MGSTADLEAAGRVMQVNLFGNWRMIQAFLPLLKRRADPRIVNVGGGAGSYGDPGFDLPVRGGAAATYGISKAALNALTSTLAAELAATPVIVNAVCPGSTATYPGAEATGADYDQAPGAGSPVPPCEPTARYRTRSALGRNG